MLSIDRASNTSVREQLIEQLRYLIASGHFPVNETLPSTRKLADQLGISFHTVRKAYQALQDEGLVDAQVGRGYTVLDRAPLEKGERMERGAEVVHDALQKLIGLGLDDTEIEYLFQEQANLLEHAQLERKLLVAHPTEELAALYAEQIASTLQRSVDVATLDHLRGHQDADFVFTPFEHLNQVMQTVPRADTVGFVTYLPAKLLEQVARLRSDETIGLVTRTADTIQPLTQQLRAHSGFSGQIMAASVGEGADHLASFVDETDLLLYTPASRRRLRPLLDDAPPHGSICPLVSPDALEAIQRAVPA